MNMRIIKKHMTLKLLAKHFENVNTYGNDEFRASNTGDAEDADSIMKSWDGENFIFTIEDNQDADLLASVLTDGGTIENVIINIKGAN